MHGSPAPEISWIVEGDEVHLLTKQNPTVLHYTLLELVELQVLTQVKTHFLTEITDDTKKKKNCLCSLCV